MRKHVCCTAVCVVCTAVLFYLHFFVYGGLLFNNPLLVGATCAAAAAECDDPVKMGLGNHGFRLTISSHGFAS